MSLIRFHVPGTPQPAGSKRAFPYRRANGQLGVRVTDDAKHGKPWRLEVAYTARQAHPGVPLSGALRVAMKFTVARPKGHYGARGLRPSAPACPIGRPDVLKLARLVEDALTGVLWQDDAQIVDETLSKSYGDTPGVEVRVDRIAPRDAGAF